MAIPFLPLYKHPTTGAHKIANLPPAERQELIRQIDRAKARGARLDPKLEAYARDLNLLPPKPIVPSTKPTQAQLDKLVKHFKPDYQDYKTKRERGL